MQLRDGKGSSRLVILLSSSPGGCGQVKKMELQKISGWWLTYPSEKY